MKKLIIIVFVFAFSPVIYSQILEENFDYNAGDSLTSHGWVGFSGGTTNALVVTSPGLVYPGYIGSGIGNSVKAINSGQDAYKSFTSNITSGSVYTSMMVKVSTARTGDYFAAYLPSTSTTLNNGRLYVRSTESGNIAFGISKTTAASGGINYGDSIFSIGITYIIVLKYTFNVVTTTDDEITLYVFNGAIPTLEPSIPYVGPISGTATDVSNLGRFTLRQGASSSSPDILVDGIFISDNWINPVPYYPVLFNPANNSINNSTTVNFIWSNFYPSIYSILEISTDLLFNNLIVRDTIYLDTSKTISGFQRDTKYFWRVRVKILSGEFLYSLTSNFKTSPPVMINVKLLFEGMYSSIFNQLVRKDSVSVYLRNSSIPFNIIDSAKSSIDTLLFNGEFIFSNAPNGNYYITLKHFNTLETWSKIGGENLNSDSSIYYYDFTSAISQAYGNNIVLKGSKYCLFSGDINQDGLIDLFDAIPIYNDATVFAMGNYLVDDLTGEGIIDLADVSICYNNSVSFVSVIRP